MLVWPVYLYSDMSLYFYDTTASQQEWELG
jgi:hypothetical protein